MTFEFTADAFDSDNDGVEDEYTVECILSDEPHPSTPGGRLYKVRWKSFAASRDSWEPPSSSVPRYTSMWLDYLKAKTKISLRLCSYFSVCTIGHRLLSRIPRGHRCQEHLIISFIFGWSVW